MGTFLNSSDLPTGTGDGPGLTPDQMIEDAEGLAILAAPCLGTTPTTLTDAQIVGVKAILRGAIMRWNDAGSGARSSVTTGPFSETIDTTVARRGMFWPSEITTLQSICSDSESGKVFAVDTVRFGGVHAATCSVNFGASYCSCGADIAGFPLFGN
jgi:hypothetical protein